MALQLALQIGRSQQRGIDDEIGAIAQRPEALALDPHAVGDRSLRRQRMAAARLGVATLEPVIVAIEEDHLELDILSLDQIVERLEQRRHGEITGAHINADGERGLHRPRPDQVRQQRQRQIVDRLITHVFQILERGRATGPRHARDHQ